MRQSLQLGGGDWTNLFSEQVAIIVYIVIAALILSPLVLRLLHRRVPDPIHVESVDEQETRAEKAEA